MYKKYPMRQQRKITGSRPYEETRLCKDYKKFLKSIDKLKQEGKCFDLFETLITESKIVYADLEKKYVITKKSLLDQLSEKAIIQRNKNEKLEQELHYKNIRMLQLMKELQTQRQKNQKQENEQKQKIKKTEKRLKKQIQKLKEKKQEENKLLEDVFQKMSEKNRLLRKDIKLKKQTIKSPFHTKSRYVQTQLHEVIKLNPIHFISKPIQIHIQPTNECFKQCKNIYYSRVSQFTDKLKELSTNLDEKNLYLDDLMKSVQKYQEKIRKLEQNNINLEQENRFLKDRIQRMNNNEIQSNKEQWKKCMSGYVKKIQNQWKKIQVNQATKRQRRQNSHSLSNPNESN